MDFTDRPEETVADDELRELIARLNVWLEGRLAIVSGRSIAQLDGILGPVAQQIAISGSHGCEYRQGAVSESSDKPLILGKAADQLRAFVAQNSGVVMEEKSYGVALHYRMLPEAEGDGIRLAETVARELGLHLQRGNMVVELRPAGENKGTAVSRMMRLPPMKGTVPIFVGDDLTDEDGFAAVMAHGGNGVLVGGTRKTVASHRLDNPAAVRGWLQSAIE